MKKLVIFDCDGVLVDSEIIANRLTMERVNSLGFNFTLEDIAKILIGTDAKTARRLFLEISPALGHNIVNVAKEEILDAYETELKPLVFPFLEKLSANPNLKRCVVSNNLLEKVVKGLECTKQVHFFQPDEIFTADLVTDGKPAPDIFYYAMNHFKVKAEECLVIEDSVAGIKGALAAGIDVIGFLGGGHAKFSWYQERIKALNVPMVYDSKELEELVNEKYLKI